MSRKFTERKNDAHAAADRIQGRMSQRIVRETSTHGSVAICWCGPVLEALDWDEMVERVREGMSQVLFAGVIIPDKQEAEAVLRAALGLEEE